VVESGEWERVVRQSLSSTTTLRIIAFVAELTPYLANQLVITIVFSSHTHIPARYSPLSLSMVRISYFLPGQLSAALLERKH
jgi:hypothetical protein